MKRTHPSPITVVPAGGDTGTPRNLRKRLALLRRYADLRGLRVLDGGCGSGAYLHALRHLGATAWGLEYQRRAVPRQSDSGIIVGDLQRAPLPDAWFDMVLLNETAEHIPDDAQGLREVSRVLKPGGMLALFSPNRRYPFETHGVYLRASGRYLPPYVPLVPYIPLALGQRLLRYPARNYWPDELRALVRQAGFRIVATGYVWQTFENISGQQPSWLYTVRPLLRALSALLEQVPLLCSLGISQMIIARKE